MLKSIDYFTKLGVMKVARVEIRLWWMVLLAFPITTFPFLPLGATVAKPLSFIPALLCFLVYLRRGVVPVHKETRYLNIFLGYVLLSSMMISTYYYGFSGALSCLRALFTLIVGYVFYLLFRALNDTEEKLARTESILIFAMMISILIEIMQFLIGTYFNSLNIIVDIINLMFVDVARDWVGRYHGLAYEPSWLASQLCLIVMPISLSRYFFGKSIRVYSFGGLSIKRELLHLILGVIGIAISGSRTALFTLLLMFLLVITSSSGLKGYIKQFSLSIVVLLVLWFVASKVEYVGDVVNVLVEAGAIMDVVLQSHAVPRVAAWVSAYQVFIENPFFGVGLGNSFRSFAENIPVWALNSSEAKGWADGLSTPNPKNMFLKLLSETGVIGTLLFFGFLFSHWVGRDSEPHLRLLSKLVFVGLFVNYFSMDTFALPTEWFALGYLASMRSIHVKSNSSYDKL